MKKIWLENYPPGVPAEIDPCAHASLKELLEQSCLRFHDKVAFSNMRATLTYAELDRLSGNFGAFLQSRGLAKGARVAIMLPNLLQYPVALFGALRAGMIVVNVNPLYTASELRHQLADSGAEALVVLENFAQTAGQALAGTNVRHVVTTQVGDLFSLFGRWATNFVVKYLRGMVPSWSISGATDFRTALAQGEGHGLGACTVRAEDVAFLQYTGGTTGRPKGAMLTHGNMVANVEQTAAWIASTLTAGAETVITALPLYHVFALTTNLLLFVRLGGRNVLVTNPRDLESFVAELRRTRFSVITGVNTLYHALLETPGFGRVGSAHPGTLKVAVAGGMAVQRSVAKRWHELMGVPLVEGYGLTEASPIVCANPLGAREFSGKLGLPVPSTEVSIRDERGAEIDLGEVGEICVHGPQVMRGYWNAPAETAAALTADGWLRTGDMGWMDSRGYVEFTERRKDVIVVSGFKAYPTEIEDAVMLHPDVQDAGAVGVPDARSGEAVVLFVVKKDPALTAEAVLAHCRQHLTGYKLPRRIEFRERLPKTLVGKILRRELQADAARSHG